MKTNGHDHRGNPPSPKAKLASKPKPSLPGMESFPGKPEMDAAYAAFWARRGLEPPSVCTYMIW